MRTHALLLHEPIDGHIGLLDGADGYWLAPVSMHLHLTMPGHVLLERELQALPPNCNQWLHKPIQAWDIK